MKLARWIIGALILITIITAIMLIPIPFLFYQDLPHEAFFGRALYILLLACFLILYRVIKGPTAADRIVAVDLLGIMIVGLCAILNFVTGRSWYIDIGMAWALQSFVTTLAFSKYLEGKRFDE